MRFRILEYGLILAVLASVAMAQPPEVLWTTCFDAPGSNYVNDIHQAADGGYVGGGSLWAAGTDIWIPSDLVLFRLDSGGNMIWSHSWPRLGSAFRVFDMPDGGFLVACNLAYDSSTGSYSYAIGLMRTDANGDSLWTRVYGEANYVTGLQDVLLLTDGRFLCAGVRRQVDAYEQMLFCMMLDVQYDTLWRRNYDVASGEIWGVSAAQGIDGNFSLAIYESISYYGQLPFILAISPDGDSLWSRQYPWPNGDNPLWLSIRERENGYVMCGQAGADSFRQTYFVGLSSIGDTLWRHIVPVNSFAPKDFQSVSDGGYVTAGVLTAFDQSGFSYNGCVVRTDSSGDTLWTRNWQHEPDILGESARGIAITDDHGYVFVLGRSEEPTQVDACLIRLAPDPTVAAKDKFIPRPSSFSLSAYPNPFNPTITISFDLPRSGDVRLAVFDVTGRHVKTLQEGKMEPGRHEAQWDAGNLPSGIYFARLEASQRIMTQKILLLK